MFKRFFHSTASAHSGLPRSQWKPRPKLPVEVPPSEPLRYKQVYRPSVMRDAQKLLKRAELSPWRGKWRIETVSLVERLPVILPEPPKWWHEFDELRLQLSEQYDKTYADDMWGKLNDAAEIAGPKPAGGADDEKKATKGGAPKGKTKKPRSRDVEEEEKQENKTAVTQSAQNDRDFDEVEEAEGEKEESATGSKDRIRLDDFKYWSEGVDFIPEDFTPAPRTTADDTNNNRHSLNRALDKRLYLVCKRADTAGPYQWEFLRREWKAKDEPLHAHAQQCVVDKVHAHEDCDFQVQFDTYHTAPSGHYFFEFPYEYQKQVKCFGAKQFFYHTYLLDGAPVVQLKENGYSDYAWVSRDELKDYLEPSYYEYVYDILQDF